MKSDLDKFEALVEQEAQLLAQLPAAPPRSACVARVQAAVIAESERLGPPGARRWTLPRWGATAAAVLLAAGLSGLLSSPLPTGGATMDDAELLGVWAEAVGESTDSLALLLEDGWLVNGASREMDSDAEIDGFLNGLEQFFEPLDAL